MTFYCSFCGKSQQEVKRIIAGPCDHNICDECIGLSVDILREVGLKEKVVQREVNQQDVYRAEIAQREKRSNAYIDSLEEWRDNSMDDRRQSNNTWQKHVDLINAINIAQLALITVMVAAVILFLAGAQ